jgi:ABC-2 type transport system ATP-binding protein
VAGPALEIDGLVKRYEGRTVVDGLSFAAASGAVTAVLGPNGAGKTTTVECCEGLRRPDAGIVRVLGLDPQHDGRRLRARVGVMLQDGGLPTGARAGEVLRHVAALHARPLEVGRLAAALGLEPVLRTTVRRLSGGQRQRLALARAVLARPRILVLDDTLSALDVHTEALVEQALRRVLAQATGIVVAHRASTVLLADKVALLQGGTITHVGTHAELLAAVPAYRDLLGGEGDDELVASDGQAVTS